MRRIENAPAGLTSRMAHFELRRLDAFETAEPGISLGRHVAGTLALASALLGTQSPGLSRTTFVHFEIAGARAYLHPVTPDISPLEIRGRYLFVRIATEWAVHKLIAAAGGIEMNCVWLSIARALILLGHDKVPLLEAAVGALNVRLRAVFPSLEIRVRSLAIDDADWESGDIRVVMEAAFGDRKDGRSWIAGPVVAAQDTQSAPIIGLARALASDAPVTLDAKAGDQPLHPCLEGWLGWPRGPQQESTELRRETLLCPDVSPTDSHGWIARPLSAASGLGVLRADIRGYKSSMYQYGGSALRGLQTRCVHNQAGLMNNTARICARVNAKGPDQVLLMHVFSDDAVVYGPVAQLQGIAQELEANGDGIGNGVDAVVFPIAVGMTAADVGHGALDLLAEYRRAKREAQ